ncbi:MAG: RtcB family protein [Candidatus ainarchaeum sp.]|nr:RtcB family protein [Candidatus ainarchaeum sp.]
MVSGLKKLREGVYEIPEQGEMRAPARIYANEKILAEIEEGAVEQLKNSATLPGIQKYAAAMPDMHWGYGFPIGGVAAFDGKQGGIVSPGGVGFDINCGVRLLRTNLKASEIKPKLKELIDVLFELIPAGIGETGKIKLKKDELGELFSQGAAYSVKKGYGWKKDLERIEENGRMKNANIEKVSEKAFARGLNQSGTLGSGNHFLEIQEVTEIFDEKTAKKFSLFKGQAVIMLHSGSRGAGHQIATDYIDKMIRAMEKYKITVPDKQLACAPISSEEGRAYLEAMNCGVNYAFANRQAMAHWIREGFEKVFKQKAEDLEMGVIYDVCHNVAKFEKHGIEGKQKEVLVHRKGATRAMPAGRKENPDLYITTGHPVIIPGSMGTPSYVLVGTETALKETFASVCHGAGRSMSRHSAMKLKRGEQVKKDLELKGQIVKGASWAGLAEEAPEAYKDIDEVIASVEISGIGKKISKHSPLAVMKG